MARIANVTFPTPRLYRWFISRLDGVAVRVDGDGGFSVLDEVVWRELLVAAEGTEVA